MRRFDVELKIHFPFKAHISARSEDEAVKRALDKAMDYLETVLQDPHRFAEFWEYDTHSDVISVSEDFDERLKR